MRNHAWFLWDTLSRGPHVRAPHRYRDMWNGVHASPTGAKGPHFPPTGIPHRHHPQALEHLTCSMSLSGGLKLSPASP